MIKIKLYSLVFFLLAAFPACKKRYPEDSVRHHLKSPASRLSMPRHSVHSNKIWTYISIKNKITGYSYPVPTKEIYIGRRDGVNCYVILTPLPESSGHWELSHNDENLDFYRMVGPTVTTVLYSFKIKKLDNDELIFENDSLEYRFIFKGYN